MIEPRPVDQHEARSEAQLNAEFDAEFDAPPAAPEQPSSLPSFLLQRADGLYVVLPELESRESLREFVSAVHESGKRFDELDYGCMHHLLYVGGPEETARLAERLTQAGKQPMLRLARDIVPFPAERRRFYGSVKVLDGGRTAEYVFAPATVNRVVEEPVYGERRADGTLPVIDVVRKTVAERVELQFEEFIAAMWNIHVRFGIDAAAVRAALAGDTSGSIVIARRLSPVEGRDAQVEELTSLRRDDTPKSLADGRIDLHQFENRFPQVAQGTRLIRKIPCVPGKPGWDIAGSPLLPKTPVDIDIACRAGTGTRVECTEEGEFIVTEAGGFLHTNPKTNTFSITDKIINHQGVSLRTTGNLVLSGDEYEEHGEVQELARVEGKHMTFMADVFGDIVSRGGRVAFKRNLATGSVSSPRGEITVAGSASRATIAAVDGDITLDYAENCLIVGKRVRIRQAVLCDIVAEELTIDTAEGSALAARKVAVGATKAWHDTEAMISLQVPDLFAFTEQLDELKRNLAQYQQALEEKRAEVEAIATQQEVKTYSLLAAKLRSGELAMNRQQEANWQKLLGRVTPLLQQLKLRNEELAELRRAVDNLNSRIDNISQRSREMSTNVGCRIGTIGGETVIRTLKAAPDAPPLHALQHRELRASLRESTPNSGVIYSGSQGDFQWMFSGRGSALTN